MELTSKDLIKLSKLAEKAAQLAGELINNELALLQKGNSTIQIHSKSTGENLASQVVTQVDLSAQKNILETLKPSIKEFDLGLLTEESTDNQSRFEKDYFWCIDPLDGTLPFIEGTTGYAVSIALVSKKGIPFIGVVFDPTTENLFTAVLNQGVNKNKKPFLPFKNSNELHFIHDRSFLNHPKYAEVLQKLESFKLSINFEKINIISHGGAVMNAIWALENIPSCYFKLAKSVEGGGSIWDYSSTACIYKELGLYVSDMTGVPLQLNRRTSSFMNEYGVAYASDEKLAKFVLSLTF
ncbi:hypothetical protein OAA91_00450 [Fibrobacterales bacterium]|nr:hypothetical protein [Fibrobacterales bacterium]